ncbi:carboxymuconolactone decarboxylase family protein [Streptomyces sp. NPDC002536]
MNTVASQVTMYADPSVSCRDPIVPGPSLYEWVRELPQDTLEGLFVPDLAEQARSLGPNDIGGALRNGCTPEELAEVALQCAVYAGAPAGIDTMKLIRQEVARFEEENGPVSEERQERQER